MNVIDTSEATVVSSVNESINEAGTEKPNTTVAAKGFRWLTDKYCFDARCWLDEHLVVGLFENKAYLVDIRKNIFDKDFSLLLGQSEVFRYGQDMCIDVDRCQCVDNEDGSQFEAIRLVFIDESEDFNSEPLLDVLLR